MESSLLSNNTDYITTCPNFGHPSMLCQYETLKDPDLSYLFRISHFS
jgi:hypothetical protein